MKRKLLLLLRWYPLTTGYVRTYYIPGHFDQLWAERGPTFKNRYDFKWNLKRVTKCQFLISDSLRHLCLLNKARPCYMSALM